MSDEWQTLDTAPRTTPPTPVLLFLPNPAGQMPPINEDVVGWWSIERAAWLTSAFQSNGQPVYPSRWQTLPADPV